MGRTYGILQSAVWKSEKRLGEKKCYEESKKPNTTVVMLIPARTDTSYFHDYIYKKAKEIRFVRGRLKFG